MKKFSLNNRVRQLFQCGLYHLTCTHTVQVSYWYLTCSTATDEHLLYNLKRDVRRMSATILLKYILTITHHSIIVQPVNSVSAVNQTSNCNWCGSVWCNDARCSAYDIVHESWMLQCRWSARRIGKFEPPDVDVTSFVRRRLVYIYF